MTPWPDSCDFPRLVYSVARCLCFLPAPSLPACLLPALACLLPTPCARTSSPPHPELRYTTHTRKAFPGFCQKKGWQKLSAARVAFFDSSTGCVMLGACPSCCHPAQLVSPLSLSLLQGVRALVRLFVCCHKSQAECGDAQMMAATSCLLLLLPPPPPPSYCSLSLLYALPAMISAAAAGSRRQNLHMPCILAIKVAPIDDHTWLQVTAG